MDEIKWSVAKKIMEIMDIVRKDEEVMALIKIIEDARINESLMLGSAWRKGYAEEFAKSYAKCFAEEMYTEKYSEGYEKGLKSADEYLKAERNNHKKSLTEEQIRNILNFEL